MEQSQNINPESSQTQNQKNKMLALDHFWRWVSSYQPEWQQKIITVLKSSLPGLEAEFNWVSADEKTTEDAAREFSLKYFGENFYESAQWAIGDALNELRNYPPKTQADLIAIAKDKIDAAVVNRLVIKSRLQSYSDILKNLDDKTKLIILLIEECFSLDGLNVDSFHKETETQIYDKCDDILKETAGDPDCDLLRVLYLEAAEVCRH